MTLHWLIARCNKFNSTEAIVFKNNRYVYSELYSDTIDTINYLQSIGLPEGAIVSVEGEFSPRSLAIILALINNNNIIVPVGDIPEVKLNEYLEISQVEVRIKVGNDDYELYDTGHVAEHELYKKIYDIKHSGLVLFSSGTTGKPKASVLDFNKLIDKNLEEKIAKRILSFLSIDHIGGINTLLYTISHGGTLIIPLLRTPESVFNAIEKWSVEILPTTPTFLNMVLISRVIERTNISSLKLVTYGTEPMPPITLRRISEKLPSVKLKQTYGLSEVGILQTKSKSNNELWIKLGNSGFNYKIISNILWVKSDFAMLGYLNSQSPFDEYGYFNTEDAVEADGDYIKILGRKSELINIGGEKVYPNEVEDILLQAENIADATVVGFPNTITGMGVKAILYLNEPEEYDDLRSRLYIHCKNFLEEFKIPMVYEISTMPHHSNRFKKMRSSFKIKEIMNVTP
ncbi:AmP-dependent synthetase and ligase [Xenorhabdus bovienii str. oregonense]|uniref:AmP-dependent synthetase and ligase n=1 Tax=Xenorhabdus bovienii str. oregonense TaxID=1398202 RepID=A0A077P6L6_XENBV|nr:fatty acid--CoA ligase family protein [Xenorhabdus bovienii]CDH05451.1 AmP-dependent synthetase and ligase [Xenorhabdus bovienii str. oregonense]